MQVNVVKRDLCKVRYGHTKYFLQNVRRSVTRHEIVLEGICVRSEYLGAQSKEMREHCILRIESVTCTLTFSLDPYNVGILTGGYPETLYKFAALRTAFLLFRPDDC